MKLAEKANEVISRLPAGCRLGVAVSGGSDSMCLLTYLINDSKVERDRITVLNVEHGIRGESSLRDTSFVREFCREKGIAFESVSLDIPFLAKENSRSIETEARIARHAFFRSFTDSGECDYILTAHNIHDRTESILMHIFRGSGIGGLVGMKEIDGYIVRPLLSCNKGEILSYLEEHGVSYRTDETNGDNAYARNYLRNEIIPLIKKRWPALDEAVGKLSALAEEATDLNCGESLLCDGITGEKVKNAFVYAGLTHDFTKKHIDAVVSLASQTSGQGIDLPHGYRALKVYDEIIILKKQEKPGGEMTYAGKDICFAGKTIKVTETGPICDKTRTVIDADKIPAGAVIRTRRDGDKFRAVNAPLKLLSDYFSDRKIPVNERDGIILLAKDSEVLCIIGVAVGERVKIDGETKRAVLLEC